MDTLENRVFDPSLFFVFGFELGRLLLVVRRLQRFKLASNRESIVGAAHARFCHSNLGGSRCG